jgi:hypothetical protein
VVEAPPARPFVFVVKPERPKSSWFANIKSKLSFSSKSVEHPPAPSGPRRSDVSLMSVKDLKELESSIGKMTESSSTLTRRGSIKSGDFVVTSLNDGTEIIWMDPASLKDTKSEKSSRRSSIEKDALGSSDRSPRTSSVSLSTDDAADDAAQAMFQIHSPSGMITPLGADVDSSLESSPNRAALIGKVEIAHAEMVAKAAEGTIKRAESFRSTPSLDASRSPSLSPRTSDVSLKHVSPLADPTEGVADGIESASKSPLTSSDARSPSLSCSVEGIAKLEEELIHARVQLLDKEEENYRLQSELLKARNGEVPAVSADELSNIIESIVATRARLLDAWSQLESLQYEKDLLSKLKDDTEEKVQDLESQLAEAKVSMASTSYEKDVSIPDSNTH